eukprot:GHRR01012058.1.p1 GENE.GHRR01012058.1~~GHRR01012058.1.p1  ORF type:complete len:132 (-),score=3.31 GHRR01012058.1:731-1126(-)
MSVQMFTSPFLSILTGLPSRYQDTESGCQLNVYVTQLLQVVLFCGQASTFWYSATGMFCSPTPSPLQAQTHTRHKLAGHQMLNVCYSGSPSTFFITHLHGCLLANTQATAGTQPQWSHNCWSIRCVVCTSG